MKRLLLFFCLPSFSLASVMVRAGSLMFRSSFPNVGFFVGLGEPVVSVSELVDERLVRPNILLKLPVRIPRLEDSSELETDDDIRCCGAADGSGW